MCLRISVFASVLVYKIIIVEGPLCPFEAHRGANYKWGHIVRGGGDGGQKHKAGKDCSRISEETIIHNKAIQVQRQIITNPSDPDSEQW